MADNVTLPGTGESVATDDVGGAQFQRIKLDLGGDGASAPVVGALPISGSVSVSNLPASQAVTGPLTDAQLRAAPFAVTVSDGAGPLTVDGTVAISGSVPVTGAFWQATQPVSGAISVSNFPGSQAVTGPLTDTQLRATALPVSGPLTDTQIRAAPIPVSGSFSVTGSLTDAELRAAPVVVNQPGVVATGTLAALNANVSLTLNGAVGFAIDLRGTFNATVQFQGSVNGTDWFTINMLPAGVGASIGTTSLSTINGAWVSNATGAVVVRAVATSYTSGTVSVTIRAVASTGMVHSLPNGQVYQEVTAPFLPLPAGASTEATLAALSAKVPALGQAAMAASQPVVIASNQTAISTIEPALILTGQTGLTAVVNNVLENPAGAAGTSVDNFRAASVQVISTGTGGTFIFEQSNDNTNWIALPVFNAVLVGATPITTAIAATASAIIYTFAVRARFVRLRIVSTITGGTIAAVSRISGDPWTPSIATVAQPSAAALNATVSGTVTANIGTGSLAAGVNRIGFVSASGIWYDDSSTVLAGAATFTGTSRDATVTAAATAFGSSTTFAREVRACAESDQTGTMWLEVSRDNTTWRRIRSVATAAITGGGFAAEIVYLPSWRYWRIGYTNGATLQTRFTIGTVAVAA